MKNSTTKNHIHSPAKEQDRNYIKAFGSLTHSLKKRSFPLFSQETKVKRPSFLNKLIKFHKTSSEEIHVLKKIKSFLSSTVFNFIHRCIKSK